MFIVGSTRRKKLQEIYFILFYFSLSLNLMQACLLFLSGHRSRWAGMRGERPGPETSRYMMTWSRGIDALGGIYFFAFSSFFLSFSFLRIWSKVGRDQWLDEAGSTLLVLFLCVGTSVVGSGGWRICRRRKYHSLGQSTGRNLGSCNTEKEDR